MKLVKMTTEQINQENIRRHLAGERLLVPLPAQPKENCRHCCGRGIIGKNIITNAPVICSCVLKRAANPEPDITRGKDSNGQETVIEPEPPENQKPEEPLEKG